MADPVTSNKALFTPAHNADPGTWDVPVNANWNNIDQALGTYTPLNVTSQSGVVALTVSQSVPLGFIISGNLTANVVYQTPAAAGGFWCVRSNVPTSSFGVYFASASGGNSVLIPAGENVIVSATGTAAGMAVGQNIASGAAGSNTQVQYNSNGVLAGALGFTFDGTTLSVPGFNNTGNTNLGSGAGSTTTINGTNISTPNGFNFNAGQFQMNAGGMLGIGTAPTAALLTLGGALAITTGGTTWPNGTVQTTAEVIQIATTGVTATPAITGTYATGTGAAPTAAGGAPITAMATTFTPKSLGSILEIEVIVKGTSFNGSGAETVLALFNGSTLVDFAANLIQGGGAFVNTLTLKTWLASPGVSAQSFTVRLGTNDGSAFGLNQTNNGGGAIPQAGWTSWISIKELQGG